MRRALLVGALLWPLCAGAARPGLTLAGYQAESGAITVGRDGARVDPYFATKALLAAQAGGLDVRPAARRWIAWLRPRQGADGRFERYCRESGRWVACATADADDAMHAVWTELLVSVAPRSGLPRAWARSLARAERGLASLRDPATGVYRISAELPVSLFMDNVEIHAAFRAVGRHYERAGDAARARRWRIAAARLHRSILAVFWDDDRGAFRVSTQERATAAFYPDAVAQIFPLTAEFPVPRRSPPYARWMAEHRSAWLAQGAVDFPWGLVALAAQRAGDRAAVLCWRERAAPLRHGAHWNVLEEAVYLAIDGGIRRGETPAGCGS